MFTGLYQECARDAIRENDGDRMVSHLKFEFMRYCKGRHPIYKQIVARMLASIGGFDHLHVAFDLKYNSTVNVTGKVAKNIESDLYNEFCNKV